MNKGIFIGSFDPFHNGHKERAINALKIFDKLIIVVADNPQKTYWFTQDERCELIKKSLLEFKDRIIIKKANSKMIQDVCHEEKVFTVFRGVKAGRTLEEEIRLQVFTNYMAEIEYHEKILFIYDITSNNDFRGSSIIKKLATTKKDFSTLIPSQIISEVTERAKKFE